MKYCLVELDDHGHGRTSQAGDRIYDLTVRAARCVQKKIRFEVHKTDETGARVLDVEGTNHLREMVPSHMRSQKVWVRVDRRRGIGHNPTV